MEKHELINCHKLIEPFIHRTPVMTSRQIDEMVGCSLYFKCENFQRMGAFKIRGAVHAILTLPESKRKKGVVTHSSGNFAQAVSLAARTLGIAAHIVMPSNAPEVKKAAVRSYGGIIVECLPSLEAREQQTREIQKETGATFLHPSNDYSVILGQGSAGLELLQEIPDLDVLIVPVGGGGLIAGVAMAAHFFGKNCKVMGAEPETADDAWRSMKSGKIETNLSTNTIADGLRTHLGDVNFPIIQNLVSEIVRISDDEIIFAMRLLYERMKIVVEPSSAIVLAAALKAKDRLKGLKVGLIISGGNVDLKSLPF